MLESLPQHICNCFTTVSKTLNITINLTTGNKDDEVNVCNVFDDKSVLNPITGAMLYVKRLETFVLSANISGILSLLCKVLIDIMYQALYKSVFCVVVIINKLLLPFSRFVSC